MTRATENLKIFNFIIFRIMINMVNLKSAFFFLTKRAMISKSIKCFFSVCHASRISMNIIRVIFSNHFRSKFSKMFVFTFFRAINAFFGSCNSIYHFFFTKLTECSNSFVSTIVIAFSRTKNIVFMVRIILKRLFAMDTDLKSWWISINLSAFLRTKFLRLKFFNKVFFTNWACSNHTNYYSSNFINGLQIKECL